MLRQRSISGNQLGSGNKVKRRSRERRHVQRLADVAGVFRSALMLVEEAPARRKIQQNGASQNSQRPARRGPPEYSSTQSHQATH
jgi:hypothetical protein